MRNNGSSDVQIETMSCSKQAETVHGQPCMAVPRRSTSETPPQRPSWPRASQSERPVSARRHSPPRSTSVRVASQPSAERQSSAGAEELALSERERPSPTSRPLSERDRPKSARRLVKSTSLSMSHNSGHSLRVNRCTRDSPATKCLLLPVPLSGGTIAAGLLQVDGRARGPLDDECGRQPVTEVR